MPESMARETCPAMLMITSSPGSDSVGMGISSKCAAVAGNYQATWSLCFCYTARALRVAEAVSDRTGFRSAAAVRRLAWSVTQTRNIGWRAFFRRSMIRSGASSR